LLKQKQPSTHARVRRQWGADNRVLPLPAVPEPVSDRTVSNARLAIVVAALAWLVYVSSVVLNQFVLGGAQTRQFALEAVFYLVVVTLLSGSSIAYLSTRLGFFYRIRGHKRVPRARLEEFFDRPAPALTVLVPSYREDARVIRMTLLSAALQEYPDLRVVLLIDDPPHPTYRRERELLDAAREMPMQVEGLLARPGAHFAAVLERFETESWSTTGPNHMHALAEQYDSAVAWLVELARSQETTDHSDTFFSEYVVGRLAADLRATSDAVRAAAAAGATLPRERVRQLYRRLAMIFHAKLSSFERKRYVSLSHEPNKAMNLNSYIGLMGGAYREITTPAGPRLARTDGAPDLEVPNPDYVLTLDADSVLLPEYCARMVYLLERPENRRVAVAQTPYSSYPGAATRLERIAGATTDIQHIVHQGMQYYDATFWVGANAVLRKRALDDLDEFELKGELEIHRYIRDRTVIEDTESSIDLRIHGWTLFNYPERLSYSSTPPDFGSLCIQRRRWSCGGLLILPKLWKQLRSRRTKGEANRFGEYFLRVNYMASIAWANIAVLLLLAYPFNDKLLSPLVIFVAVPYFVVMASDLKYCGYKYSDVFRIYGFNLVLLPVHLAGVGNSILQALTGEKVAFKRTPKVANRTSSPLLFVLLPYLLVALSTYTVISDYLGGRWVNLIYASINAVLASYAIVAYVGLWNSIVDIWANLIDFLYTTEKPSKQKPAAAAAPSLAGHPIAEWEMVLHYGTDAGDSRPAAAPAATRER
jgi:cellulose synthase/poly-beta-1,6-N-acetylglucosamine synthase-like glycosyltransferase